MANSANDTKPKMPRRLVYEEYVKKVLYHSYLLT